MPVPPNPRRNSASVMTRPSGEGEGVSQTGIVLVGDRGVNTLDGATFSLNGVEVPYAPGAAQWLPTTPPYTEIFIPANAGLHTVKVVLQTRVVKQKTGVQVYFTPTPSANRTRVRLDPDMVVLRADREPAMLSLFQEHRSVTIDGVEQEKPEKTGSPASFRYRMPDVSPTHNIIVDVDDTHRYSFPNYYIMPGTMVFLPLVDTALISTSRTNISPEFVYVGLGGETTYTHVGNSGQTGIVLVGDTNSIGYATFSLDGVAVAYAPGAAQWLPTTPAFTRLFIPATAGSHTVRLTKGGRTLIAADKVVVANQVTDVPVSEMQVEMQAPPLTAQLTVTGVAGWMVAIALPGVTSPLAGPVPLPASGSLSVPVPVGSYDLAVLDGTRPLQVRRIAVPAAGLTVDTRTYFEAPPTAQLTVTGVAGWMVAIALPGVTSPLAGPVPLPASGSLSVPVPVGSYDLAVLDGTRPLQVRRIAVPAAGLTVDTRTYFEAPPTGIVLVGDMASIGEATFSLDGVAMAFATGAARWLPTTPANTRLFIPAAAGAHVVRLIKGGRTLIANSTVAANMVTDVPVSEMQQEMLEMPPEEKKEKLPAVVPLDKGLIEHPPPSPFPVDRFGPPGPGLPPPRALNVVPTMPTPTPTPGMSMTSKLIIGGLVAAAIGGGYYWYLMQPKANPARRRR